MLIAVDNTGIACIALVAGILGPGYVWGINTMVNGIDRAIEPSSTTDVAETRLVDRLERIVAQRGDLLRSPVVAAVIAAVAAVTVALGNILD